MFYAQSAITVISGRFSIVLNWSWIIGIDNIIQLTSIIEDIIQLEMYHWLSLCTLYILACQVRVTVVGLFVL